MGRGRGHGHRSHHFGSHRHRHYHFGGVGATMDIGAEAYLDMMHNSAVPPFLINGIYSFTGSEMAFRAQIDQPINLLVQQGILQQQQQQQQQLNMQMLGDIVPPLQQDTTSITTLNVQVQPQSTPSSSIQQINITLVGNKTKPTNNCCAVSTFMIGGLLILPLFMMCCMWWKKIVYPLYELSSQTYKDIGLFLEKNPTANNLNLTVIDNTFGAQKARILFEILSKSHITAFTFVNQALDCNGQFNEADDFANNMLPIKSLSNVVSSITWGSMIV